MRIGPTHISPDVEKKKEEIMAKSKYYIMPKKGEREGELGIVLSPVRRIIWNGWEQVGVLHTKNGETYFNTLPGHFNERKSIMAYLDAKGIKYKF